MKEILGRIYYVYLALLFAVTMIPVALIVFIQKSILSAEKFPTALHSTFRVWMGIFMPLIFCPVRHYGREKFEKGKNYVVVVNHNSFMDIPVSAPGVPVPSITLAKVEISKVPFFGYIYKQGTILLDRKDRKSRIESFSKMKSVLQSGLSLCLYPEGTRNKSGKLLGKFKDGAFRVAVESQTDIMIGVILGTKKILHPTKKMFAWPHRIEFHFLGTEETKTYAESDISTVRDGVRKRMLDFITLHKDKLG